MNNSKKNRNVGAAFLFFIFGLLFLIIFIRIVSIQVSGEVNGKELRTEAAKRYLQKETLEAKRGNIFDRNKEAIAENSSAYTLIAILDEKMTINKKKPRHVVNPEDTAKQLAKFIDMPEKDIYERLNVNASLPEGDKRFQVEFGKMGNNLSLQVKKEIEALELPGIIFEKEMKRFYPNGIFASHVIGYAQKDEVTLDDGTKAYDLIGKMGLEQSFNKEMKGTNGSAQYDSDLWSYILPTAEKQVQEPMDGKDLYLTIDKKIQTFLEDAMTKADEKYKPKRMMAIVADAKTGAILGMAQRPTFHPATREGIEDAWQNELVESAFEPGSTMKIFSLAAAIEEGKYNGNDTFMSGKYKVDEKSQEIRDHNGEGWGEITFLEGVQKSSNVAFAELLEKMGTETWRKYMEDFKFGHKTGIPLPNESSGNVLYNWPIEKVTSVFGQGTTVTALQLVQAMTVITNNGNMMKPYLVEKVVDPNTKEVTKFEPEIIGTPVSKTTANEVSDILRTVITEGTGTPYDLDGYEVFGKTGTAQISEGGYLQGEYLYSFLGAAPVDDPELIVYIATDRPQLEGGETGADSVAAVFNPVMQNSLQYLNIEPSTQVEAELIELPDFKEYSLAEAKAFAKNNNVQLTISGNGEKIIDQIPEKGHSLLEGGKIILRLDGDATLPDLTGMSKRDVLKVADVLGMQVTFKGEGYVVSQSLKQGTVFREGDELVVTLKTYNNENKKK